MVTPGRRGDPSTAPTRAPAGAEEVSSLPDHSGRSVGWRGVVMVLIFLAWLGFLIAAAIWGSV